MGRRRVMFEAVLEWRKGIRLYIAIAVLLITLETWWWAHALYAGSVLFATRLEEVYAWLGLGLIALAVAIGPTYSTWPWLPGRLLMHDARRLFGVGGAWFASLHVAIAYVALFKVANPLGLPRSYQQSFAVGSLALVILLAMAFTSFDGALRGLGIWWFRLHRFVYLALLATLLHAFIIGTHATHWPALVTLTVVALYILVLHLYLTFRRDKPPTRWRLLAIASVTILLVAVFYYGYSQRLGS